MKRLAVFLLATMALPGAGLSQDNPSDPEVVLDSGLRFTLSNGKEVEINGGIYQLQAQGEDSLQLRSGEEEFEIVAEQVDLEEEMLAGNALSFQDDAGVQHIVLFQADGTALSSIGHKETEVQQRGTPTRLYATVDRTKSISAAVEPIRISPIRYRPGSWIQPPKIVVQTPAKDDMWIHGNEYELRWISKDGTYAKVGDEVRIRMFRTGDGQEVYCPWGGCQAISPEANSGTKLYKFDAYFRPGTFQFVVESAANSAVFGKSQPFTVRVTEPCKTGGTVVKCITAYLRGYNERETWGLNFEPNGRHYWCSADDHIYEINGGKATYGRSSGGCFINLFSGGYERPTYGCGLGQTCGGGREDGVVSRTIRLHASD